MLRLPSNLVCGKAIPLCPLCSPWKRRNLPQLCVGVSFVSCVSSTAATANFLPLWCRHVCWLVMQQFVSKPWQVQSFLGVKVVADHDFGIAFAVRWPHHAASRSRLATRDNSSSGRIQFMELGVVTPVAKFDPMQLNEAQMDRTGVFYVQFYA